MICEHRCTEILKQFTSFFTLSGEARGSMSLDLNILSNSICSTPGGLSFLKGELTYFYSLSSYFNSLRIFLTSSRDFSVRNMIVQVLWFSLMSVSFFVTNFLRSLCSLFYDHDHTIFCIPVFPKAFAVVPELGMLHWCYRLYWERKILTNKGFVKVEPH